MPEPLVVIAGSGYLAEVAGIVAAPEQRAVGRRQGSAGHREVVWQIVAVVDEGDGPVVAEVAQRLGVEVLADLAHVGPTDAVACAGGSPLRRAEVMASGRPMPVLVHADATIGPWVELGDGTIVSPGARITASVVVGRCCLIHTGAIISHDDRLGDFVTVSPSATLCGGVEVGDGASVFAGATVLPGVRIGPGAVIAAGALVRADVDAQTTVAGIPARPIG